MLREKLPSSGAQNPAARRPKKGFRYYPGDVTLELQKLAAITEPAPTRDEVLQQGFRFKSKWWKDRVPEFWPEQLDELPNDPERQEYQRVARSDVFDIARSDLSPTGLTRTLLASYVWGTGDWGFLVGRRARTFTRNDSRHVKHALAEVFEEICNSGAVTAYGRLARDADCYIPYLGPAFFTKWLYFVAWSCTPDGLQPLILDRFVTISLNEVATPRWSESGPWTAHQYRAYLESAQQIPRWSPDAVEMRLFTQGRAIYRQRKQLE